MAGRLGRGGAATGIVTRIQRKVYGVFAQLREAPDSISEFTASDEKGRDLEVFIVDGFAFYCWIDFADRHVKVLAIGKADGPAIPGLRSGAGPQIPR